MRIIDTTSEEYKKLIDGVNYFGEGLEDVQVILTDCFGDKRGFFSPYFLQKIIEENNKHNVFNGLVQENFSNSQRGVFRGLHYQLDPKCQTKVVSVLEGEVIDVIVDIRPDSPTFRKWLGIRLKPFENQLVVPKGFAHGFLAVKDNSLFHYLVDNDYAPNMEDGILWNDKCIDIDWESIFKTSNIKEEDLIISDKDKVRSTLDEKLAKNEIPFKRSDLTDTRSERYYNSRCKVMVTGGAGQLGYDVIKELVNRGYKDIYAPTIEELDLTDKEAVDKAMDEFKPNLVIHCAAYTNVEAAEDNEELATNINVNATGYIADKCKELDSKLIYISTDYVFDGTKTTPYTIDDETNPLSVYGKTKLMGERKALNNPKTFIVRTSWVFGINGKNFVKTMLELSKSRDEVSVVCDQIGSPTYTVDLARFLVDLAATEEYGYVPAHNEGYCSWAEFAEKIFDYSGKNVKVKHVTSEEYPTKADRPEYSCMDTDQIVKRKLRLLPHWRDALPRFLDEYDAIDDE